MNNSTKPRVLFLCTGNSARSQMAEALLRHKAGNRFDVYSAGTHPETVDQRALDALAKYGIETKGVMSKDVDSFTGEAFDYVISLCDKASVECRSYPNAGKQLAWDFPDPKSRSGDQPFYLTLNELNTRLAMFLLVEEKQIKQPEEQANEASLNEFFKCLTDPIRLKTLMLSHYHGELCVCELMEALQEESQPKVSRNLAVLKKSNIIKDRKHGQWVFYQINPNLPLWAKTVIAQTTENNIGTITSELHRLDIMKNRPNRASFCK
ncbi:metalloregulator ArsR/SmtB family transcription factor [Psychromonas sp. GE-S-Ul-11]|uniref:metalloregulator ArsR/SmtB family transcription factor n=1 Tax=Psychromonas sp. GE-S-Ul-11 TaxID=3241170 RepID=UPI00390C53F3